MKLTSIKLALNFVRLMPVFIVVLLELFVCVIINWIYCVVNFDEGQSYGTRCLSLNDVKFGQDFTFLCFGNTVKFSSLSAFLDFHIDVERDKSS